MHGHSCCIFFFSGCSDIGILKPTWRPKAQIPIAVPKLPTEYIHRHRLMKQVVNCLLEPTGVPQRATDDDGPVRLISIGSCVCTSLCMDGRLIQYVRVSIVLYLFRKMQL
jgi:hypothetical protein